MAAQTRKASVFNAWVFTIFFGSAYSELHAAWMSARHCCAHNTVLARQGHQNVASEAGSPPGTRPEEAHAFVHQLFSVFVTCTLEVVAPGARGATGLSSDG